jgi:S1-C subfamily serine protease
MIRGETGLDQKPFETVLNVILKETQVVVGEVMPGAQGASLGLLAGDIVYRYAGHRISTVRQLTKIIEDIQKGPVELEIQRESQMLRLSAKPGRLGILIKEGPVSPSEQK